MSHQGGSEGQSNRDNSPFSPVFEDATDVLRHALFNAFTERQLNALLEDSTTYSTPTTGAIAHGESAFQTNNAPFVGLQPTWMMSEDPGFPVTMDGAMPYPPVVNNGSNRNGTPLSPNAAFLEMFGTLGGALGPNALSRGAADASELSKRKAFQNATPPAAAQTTTTGALAAFPLFYAQGTQPQDAQLPPPPPHHHQHQHHPQQPQSYMPCMSSAAAAAGGLPPYGAPSAAPAPATYMTAYGPIAFTFSGDLAPFGAPPPPAPPLAAQRAAQTHADAVHRVATGNSADGPSEPMLPPFAEPHPAASAGSAGSTWSNSQTNRPLPLHVATLAGGGGGGVQGHHANASSSSHSFTAVSGAASRPQSNAPYTPHHQHQHQHQQQQMNASKSSTAPIPASPSKSAMNATITEVFDAEFRKVFQVPTSCVVHLPPARLNITRLVLCRNYRAGERDSCAMGANCKFVHADCDYAQLPTHSIHVNYFWRELDVCTYARAAETQSVSTTVPLRLWADSIAVGPDGCVTDTLAASSTATPASVTGYQTNGNDSAGGSYITAVPSHHLLRTQGTTQFLSQRQASVPSSANMDPLISCEAYELDGICRQGEDCAFAHRIIMDPSTKSAFKRAPRRRHPNSAASNTGHNSVANSPRFAPLVGTVPVCGVSATATPVLRAQGPQPCGGTSSMPPQPHSPLLPRGHSEVQTVSVAHSKSGTGSYMEATSDLATPVSSSLGLTSAAAVGAFGVRLEQWVMRAVRMQLLTTLPPVTSTCRPAHQLPVSTTPSSAAADNTGAAPTTEDGAITVVIPAAMAATLLNTDSIGTLLYVPRGSDHATVLGPVTAEDVLPST